MVSGLRYLPRTDGGNGTITKYEVYIKNSESDDWTFDTSCWNGVIYCIKGSRSALGKSSESNIAILHSVIGLSAFNYIVSENCIIFTRTVRVKRLGEYYEHAYII